MKSNLVEKSSIFNKTRKFTQIVVSLEKDIYFHLCLPEYIDLFLNKLPSKEDFITKFQLITIDLFSHPIPTPYHWLAHSFVCVFSYDKKIIKIFGKVEDTYYW